MNAPNSNAPFLNAYDAFAWLYDKYWAAPLQEWQMPALDRLLLAELPAGARVLDVCCGTGHLARELVSRGWPVTGVDNSFGMLELARSNVPQNAEFLKQSAAELALPHCVDAAVCTFDSINHILDSAQLLASFLRIKKALTPGAAFVFDVNTPEAYGERWNASATVIEPDHTFFLRGRYDSEARLGSTEITIFRLEDQWRRTDVALQQRPWTVTELTALLTQAGFVDIEHWHAQHDLKLEGHYGIGREYVRCLAPRAHLSPQGEQDGASPC